MSIVITSRSSGSSFTPIAPTIQTFLTGSGTYTTPVSPAPLYLKVTMVGGGGGGSTSGAASDGSAGTDSTFGTSLLIASAGEPGKVSISSGGAGGVASVNSPAIQLAAISGGSGTGLCPQGAGGAGGDSAFGGAGGGGSVDAGGSPAYTVAAENSGSGGGGGGATTSPVRQGGAGGGAGGYLEAIISSPSPTYSYTVGALGAGGSGGATNGGDGADGIIIVEEFYQ